MVLPFKTKAQVRVPAGKHAPPVEDVIVTCIVPEVTFNGGHTKLPLDEQPPTPE
jgi:hypothetical protein